MAWQGSDSREGLRSLPPERRSICPRRPPAHRSVSLLHPQPSRNGRPSGSFNANSSTHRIPTVHRESLNTVAPFNARPVGLKSSSTQSSNAEKWFEESNNQVHSSNTFADSDTPFFLRNNSSSSGTPPDAPQRNLKNDWTNHDHANSLPLHAGLLHLGTDGSGTDDFRSVIDDLTIENKKLKRKLKKYEKLHDTHLEDEKLFEVRIHGLPPEKKRELEDILYKFTASLSNSESKVGPSVACWSRAPALKPGLSQNDSAYASMPESAQGSTTQSGSDSKPNITPTQYLAARRQNIHDYLHDIPEGLLPQQTPARLTEHAKKKLVVRKLEQLFSGKDATSTDRQHSFQQQEVSHIAARSEGSVATVGGHRVQQEGSREANIMDQETEDPVESNEFDEKQSPARVLNKQQPVNDSSQQGSDDHAPLDQRLEQRPTRPLDLDPHRAQVPADNIQYMRQMGFSPEDTDSTKPPHDGHGWIYLNFLINMAQLHTLNVTSEFVRKALVEHSSRFELSNDGRKVRWKSASVESQTGRSDQVSSGGRAGTDTPDVRSPHKRPKLTHRDSEQSAGTSNFKQISGTLSRPRAQSTKHAYTPMFFHRDSSDDTDDSSSDEGEQMCSALPVPNSRDVPGVVASGICTNSAPARKKQKLADGPIIFYNNARFCTDLSGDLRSSGNHNTPLYASVTMAPVGYQQGTGQQTYEKRGPLADASKLPEPMILDNVPTSESMDLAFLPASPANSGSSQEHQPIDLEATGIGGVWPADNFAISVRSRLANVDRNHLSNVTAKALPPGFARMLSDSTSKPRPRAALQRKTVASKVENLPPSELPPALSLMVFGDDSVDNDSDDYEDNESEDRGSPEAPPRATAPLPIGISYAISDDENENYEDDEEVASDGEVDFLAAARELDPEAIREKEREYDANMAERLAEEIPAGSSAATAGGGSGFPSPVGRVDRDEGQRASRPGIAQRASMIASVSVAGLQDSSDSDSEFDDSDEHMSIRS